MSVQEKLEMEQVPLQSDVDAPPMIDDISNEKDTDEEQPMKKKTPCRWFFRKKDGEVTTDNGEVIGEGKKLHYKWWHRKDKCMMNGSNGTNNDGTPQMTVGMNLLDRDDKYLNDHIVMDFSDVFAEPDSCHSWNWTWLSANRTYAFTSATVYRILAAIIAIPLAIVFGIVFGVMSAIGVYIGTPLGRLLAVPCKAVAKAYNFAIRNLLDPIFSSLGLMCPKAHHQSMMKTSPTDLA